MDGLVPTVAEPRIDELINDASVVAVNLESLSALCPKSAALCLESLALNARAIDRFGRPAVTMTVHDADGEEIYSLPFRDLDNGDNGGS